VARILLVDDDDAIVRLLKLLLLEDGEHDVRTAECARDALHELPTFAPDLLITDYRLPDLDGLTLVQTARQAGYQGAVLMLTASASGDSIVESLRTELGSESVYLKPFDIDEFVDHAMALLDRAHVLE